MVLAAEAIDATQYARASARAGGHDPPSKGAKTLPYFTDALHNPFTCLHTCARARQNY